MKFHESDGERSITIETSDLNDNEVEITICYSRSYSTWVACDLEMLGWIKDCSNQYLKSTEAYKK